MKTLLTIIFLFFVTSAVGQKAVDTSPSSLKGDTCEKIKIVVIPPRPMDKPVTENGFTREDVDLNTSAGHYFVPLLRNYYTREEIQRMPYR